VINVMELLVTKFFKLRKGDFEEWEEEPEEWEKRGEEISEAWEFSVRTCSEKLFLDLVINFKDLLIPRLLNVFYSFASKYEQVATRSLLTFSQNHRTTMSCSKIRCTQPLDWLLQAWSST
jgi:hypothetical protein